MLELVAGYVIGSALSGNGDTIVKQEVESSPRPRPKTTNKRMVVLPGEDDLYCVDVADVHSVYYKKNTDITSRKREHLAKIELYSSDYPIIYDFDSKEEAKTFIRESLKRIGSAIRSSEGHLGEKS